MNIMCRTKCVLKLYRMLHHANKNRNVENGAGARNTDCTQKQIQFVKLHKSHVATVHAATLPTVHTATEKPASAMPAAAITVQNSAK